MVKVFEDRFPAGTQGSRKPGMYMDGHLVENLDVLKKAVTEDWDGLIVIDGPEGSGKSVLAQQIAYYCDPGLEINRIVFTPDDFRSEVLSAKKHQAIVYDEAFAGLSSRKTMSETNHTIVSMLTEIRQKNLFLFVVLPSFFDLDKYVALWRSRALLHVYADRFTRGFFKFYSYSKKKELYVLGKKYYNYHAAKADFSGRFVNFYPLPKEEYQKKKINSLRRHDPAAEKMTLRDMRSLVAKEFAINMFRNDKFKLTKTDIGNLLGLHRTTVALYLKEGDE